MDKFSDFVTQHRHEFDEELPAGHQFRFGQKLRKTILIRKAHFLVQISAAACILLFAVLWQSVPESAQIASTDPEMKHVELFYRAEIDKKLVEIEKNNCIKGKIEKKTIEHELHEIEQNYQEMISDMVRVGNLNAAKELKINCLQMQRNLVEHILIQIQSNC